MPDTYMDQWLDTMTDRLNLLELQAAALGLATPPHIAMEIDKIKEQIENTILSGQSIVSVALLERLEPIERWKRLYDAIWELEVKLYSIQKNIDMNVKQVIARHTEFNELLQRCKFDIELLKKEEKRLYIIVVAASILFLVIAYITAVIL